MIPVLTPLQVIRHFQSLQKSLAKIFQESFCSRNEQSLFGGIHFEVFHAAFECLRRMLWIDKKLQRLEATSIVSFYGRAALCSKDARDSSFKMTLHNKYAAFTASVFFTEYFVAEGRVTGCFCFGVVVLLRALTLYFRRREEGIASSHAVEIP
jgi:hypothetical protein